MKDAMSIVACARCMHRYRLHMYEFWRSLDDTNTFGKQFCMSIYTVPASRQGVDEVGGMALKILGHNMPLVQ